MSNFRVDKKIDSLVETLRNCATDEELKNKQIIIPNQCEKYGFVRGCYNLKELLYFLADMIEE